VRGKLTGPRPGRESSSATPDAPSSSGSGRRREARARPVGTKGRSQRGEHAGAGAVPRPTASLCGRRARADGVDSTEVREWAKAQGIEVKDRGRVPAELVVRFKAATAQ
jgi:hypothetical protein